MAASDQSHGLWVVALSFLLAFVLSVISLPDFFPAAFSYARPEWVAMVLIYWVIATPHRIGITVAWSCGLVVDLLRGSLLGQHGLALIVVAYIASSLYQRMRMFPTWQQGAIVFAIVGLSQLIIYWIDNISGIDNWSLLYLLPSVVSALLWPSVYASLRAARRRFNVS
ncbi:MAG: rod shape-determining protein MreD [Pseudomonadales bacterium]|jgi:rod shape-determining protein MreD|nr:rod shape-determining protein MreD [Pseudomonadales bacterium]MDP7145004.1 rod shape-determining protein MreD [Pseudomonadales bacterium]MDP7357186.1 rod shape-determining protein MreD [Pseudomonadales bacterium]MDP7594751.1 rod shape-determining protein MreD [Pseudomonadales bacterium]HJN50070.1 rod shape-determining protein MreD [Pseudomonadales bacterium]